MSIPISLPKESTRQQITEKVRASRKAQEQSKQLLGIAKNWVWRYLANAILAWLSRCHRRSMIGIYKQQVELF